MGGLVMQPAFAVRGMNANTHVWDPRRGMCPGGDGRSGMVGSGAVPAYAGNAALPVVQGIYSHRVRAVIGTNQLGHATATCDASQGEYLVSGGYALVSQSEREDTPFPRGMVFFNSYPATADGARPSDGAIVTSWTVDAFSRPGDSFDVYAVCARGERGSQVLPPRAYLAFQSPPPVAGTCDISSLRCRIPDDHSATVATAACSGTWPVLTGGGFWSGSVWMQGTVVVASVPDVSKGRWTVYQHYEGSGYAGSGAPPSGREPFYTYAVCASDAAVSPVPVARSDVVFRLDPKSTCPSPGPFFYCAHSWIAPAELAITCPSSAMLLSAGVINQGDGGATYDPLLETLTVAPATADDGRIVDRWQIVLNHDTTGYFSPEKAADAAHDITFGTTAVCAMSKEAVTAHTTSQMVAPTIQPTAPAADKVSASTRYPQAAIAAAVLIVVFAATVGLLLRGIRRRRKSTRARDAQQAEQANHPGRPHVSTKLTVNIHVRGARSQ